MRRPVIRHEFPGRRWLSISMRTLHIVGVVLTAVTIFGKGAHPAAGAVLMLVSGAALYAIDLWHHRQLWRELAGVFVAVKLTLLVAMLLVPEMAATVFWLLVVTSSVVSHAPRRFRHMRLLGSHE
jgi:hypothetical protein